MCHLNFWTYLIGLSTNDQILKFQNAGPLKGDLTLESCQNTCDKNTECFSWSYHVPSKKCYLKNQNNYLNFVQQQDSSFETGYISGVKHCEAQENEISTPHNLKLFIHGHQLKALHANFGKQIHPGIKVSSLTFEAGTILQDFFGGLQVASKNYTFLFFFIVFESNISEF